MNPLITLARVEVSSPSPACELCWSITPERHDEGIGSRVIDCLSEAFCACGVTAFISDLPQAGDRLLDRAMSIFRFSRQPVIKKVGYSLRRLRMPRVRSRSLWLIATQRPDIARNFFLIQAWHYAPCQIAFLRDALDEPLELADADIQAAIRDGGWKALQTVLHDSSSRAVCTPGGEGDRLKFVFADANALRHFDAILGGRCAIHQMPYSSAL